VNPPCTQYSKDARGLTNTTTMTGHSGSVLRAKTVDTLTLAPAGPTRWTQGVGVCSF
jgi:hypothetical protein